MRVISFCLYGNIPRYTIGAIKNAELAKEHYPEFQCWFYIHKESVPEEIINTLTRMDNVKIIMKTGNLKDLHPMLWRFESIDEIDVDINLSRDTDSRIMNRESLAVYEWINSGHTFHIMRDHPHHMNDASPIMGGMFGTRKIKNIVSWKYLINTVTLKKYGRDLYDSDQIFLKEHIYPNILDSCMIHSTFGPLMGETKTYNFIPFCKDLLFIGGYVYEDESTSKTHIDALRRRLNRS